MLKDYSYKWFMLAIVSLSIGGSFAFLVGMSRTTFGYSYFSPDYMYHALVGHVVLAILLWLLSFAVVLWSYYFKTAGNYISYKLSFAGALLTALSALLGRGEAVANNYVPVIVDPLFFSGIGIFFLGFSINAFYYLKEAIGNIWSKNSIINTLSASVIIAIIMIASMLHSLMSQRADSAPLIFYERLFWIPGHIQQILNGALLAAVWHALLNRCGHKENPHPFLRYANLVLVISAAMLFLTPFFYDPVERASKALSEMIYAIGLGMPIFMHAVNIIISLKRDSKAVAYISLTLSMAIYFLGIAIAYSGFGNDLRVPAHYHGAVTSLTLGLMGLSYHLIKEFKQKVVGEGIARLQAIIYGVGMLLFIIGLFFAGLLGAPRKTYGVGFAASPIVLSALTVMGIGTLLAVAGGVLFVFYTMFSLIRKT